MRMATHDPGPAATSRPWRQPWPAPPLWFGLVFAAAGLLVVALGVAVYLQESELASRGVTTTAVVAERSISSDDGTTYRIRYGFSLPGGPAASGSATVDRSTFDRLAVGDSVNVTYLPEHPSTSRLGRADDVRTTAPLGLGGVGGFFALIGIFITVDALRRVGRGPGGGPGPAEAMPGTYRFQRPFMRILVDLVLAPIGAVAFLVAAVVFGSPLAFVGFGFFGVLMAVASLLSIRRGIRRTIFEVGPAGIWTPEMGRLGWDEIAEVRLESMRGPSGGDAPTTTRYLRVGVVPKDASLAERQHLARLGTGLTRGFLGFVRRMSPQVRVGPVDLAPFGVADYEIEQSIDDVVDAVRGHAPVVDMDERRARETAPRWVMRAAAGAATPPLVEAEVRALDARLAPDASASRPTPLVAPAPAAAPRATFQRPARGVLSLVVEGWMSLVFVGGPVLFIAIAAISVLNGMPVWFGLAFAAIPAVALVQGRGRVRESARRLRRAVGPSETLAIGAEGIWTPEMGRLPWDRVAEVRTERAGLTAGGPGEPQLERWRLVVVPAEDGEPGGPFWVESDELDANFDDVLDLVRYYHPVVETG